MYAVRVRRDSNPERELLLILITIKPSSSEREAFTEPLLVVENDAVESLVRHVERSCRAMKALACVARAREYKVPFQEIERTTAFDLSSLLQMALVW